MTTALERGLRIIELLAEEDTELTLKEIGRRLGIPSPSLWRLLSLLKERGYVIYDPDKRTYRLGFKFLYMGNVLLGGAGYRSQAREHLKELVALTGETAELSSRIKDQLVLIDQVEGPDAIRLFSRVGSAYPYFHATAPGKVYLAHLEKEKFYRVMEKMGLPAITPYTKTDIKELDRELDRVRERGFAVDHQELRVGVSRVAAPLYGKDRQVMACVGVAGPSFRLTPQKEEEVGRAVLMVAKRIMKEIGGI